MSHSSYVKVHTYIRVVLIHSRSTHIHILDLLALVLNVMLIK